MIPLTPKEYLRQINALEIKIKIKQDQILQERTRAESCTSVLSERVKSSPSQDNLPSIISKIWEYEKDMDKLIDELYDLKREVMETLDKMSNADHIKILDMKYLKNKTLVEIAEEMNYSYPHIKRKHGWALEEFKRNMNS